MNPLTPITHDIIAAHTAERDRLAAQLIQRGDQIQQLEEQRKALRARYDELNAIIVTAQTIERQAAQREQEETAKAAAQQQLDEAERALEPAKQQD